jgi:hypothetical protein
LILVKHSFSKWSIGSNGASPILPEEEMKRGRQWTASSSACIFQRYRQIPQVGTLHVGVLDVKPKLVRAKT